jgi:hypothetical protein
MSYLTQYATRGVETLRPARRGARVDERVLLNFPEFDGGAHVRSFVEDTSAHRIRRRRMPSPRLKLRITDCANQIHLDFSVDSHESRANSLHKIETLIASLERFHAGLRAEAELRAARETSRSRTRKEIRCRT